VTITATTTSTRLRAFSDFESSVLSPLPRFEYRRRLPG